MTESSTSPNPDKRSNAIQIIANVATILVAIFAIGLSIWEGRENRLHNRLSVLPQLERVEHTSRDGVADSTYKMKLGLENRGLGPAVIEDIFVFYRDSLIFRSQPERAYYTMSDVRRDLESLPFQMSIFTYSRKAGELLQAGKEHLILDLDVPVGPSSSGTGRHSTVRRDILEKYSFVFCYCSVYKEHCQQVFIVRPPPQERVCSF